VIAFLDMDAFYHTGLVLPPEVVVTNDRGIAISVAYPLRDRVLENHQCPDSVPCYPIKPGERKDLRDFVLDLRDVIRKHMVPCSLFRVDSLVIPFLKYKEQVNDICGWLYGVSKLPFSVGLGADIWEAELMCERAKATKISVAR